jgi:hypothetical protein
MNEPRKTTPKPVTIGHVQARIILYLANSNVVVDCLKNIKFTMLANEGFLEATTHQAVHSLVRSKLAKLDRACPNGGDISLTKLGEAAVPFCQELWKKWGKK